ncbi:squamosa promoter-binding 6 isoform X1 [Micractinium conductrix]|uniref:Squamosa promoter-binding 6 isoform X1 n=1 Tax=Micractinium conductrix TaxID=554055 RepID=A0A2P6VJJ7_9CHLO|nr:squamosa promoter-binding 6 isoform X1 [Micractinium conductrix]|eukprot:PSC74248.1 squamosa promoter-binding 6 isoform X1 [Micractinium conductrix]
MEGYDMNGGVEGAQTMAGQHAAKNLHAAAAAAAVAAALPVVDSYTAQLAGDSQARAGLAGTGTVSSPALLLDGGRSRPGSSGGGGAKSKNAGPLFCQVVGCGEPLEGLKEYHQRYKVCETHLKIPSIIRDGIEVRFCQQCGRFQPLPDFDADKRSCRVRLQRHNARRRKRPREGKSGGGGGGGELGGSEYVPGRALTAEQLAHMVQYVPAGPAVPVSPLELQAMHSALHFATDTLAHIPLAGPKAPGEEGTEELEDDGEGAAAAGAAGMGPGSMPFVPPPDTMILLLKSYAAMFHYTLDSATIRALAPISEVPAEVALPEGTADAAGAAGLPDALGVQQQQLLLLLQQAGVLGGALPFSMPAMLAGGGAAAAGELLDAEGARQLSAGGDDGRAEAGAAAEGHAAAAAGEHEAAAGDHAQQFAAEPLTAAQLTAAVIYPIPSDAAEAAEWPLQAASAARADAADAAVFATPGATSEAAAAAAAAAEMERAALAAVQAQVEAHLAAVQAQARQRAGAAGMDGDAEQGRVGQYAPPGGASPRPPPPPPPPPAPMSTELRGSPRQPWVERFNLTVQPLCAASDWLTLATAAALWARIHPMPPASHAFLAVASLASLAMAAWRRAAAAAPGGGSYARWRELPAALLRLFGFGWGAGNLLIVAFMESLEPAQGSGWPDAAWHAALLTLASLAPSLLSLWLMRPMRIGLALPVQLALTLHCSQHNVATCQARALAGHPAALRFTHQAYQYFLVARRLTSPPAAPYAALEPAGECAVLLTAAQLWAALALPAVAQAVLESRLWDQHAAQRRRAGLPREFDVAGFFYRELSHARAAFNAPLLALAGWLLTGTVFDAGASLAPHGAPAAGGASN